MKSNLLIGLLFALLSPGMASAAEEERASTPAPSAAQNAGNINTEIQRRPARERRERKIAAKPNGRRYYREELRLTFTEEFAARLSGLGTARRQVDVSQIIALHPSIARLEAGHSSSRAWLRGEELPVAVRGDGRGIPRIARNVTVILKRGSDAEMVAAELRKFPQIERASLKYQHPLHEVPNDPDFAAQQWAPQQIGMVAAWDVVPRNNVRVAIVDSGVDLQHPEFENRIVWDDGFADFDDGDEPSDRRNGFDHGTHVAGIAAASRNNGQGMAGISNHVELIVMNCASWNDDTGKYGISDAEDAIDESVDQGARVINCSFGGDGDINDAVDDAINSAFDYNFLIVAAAGNSSVDTSDRYWGQSGVPLIVTATMRPAAPATIETFDASYSNFGTRVNIAAPGTAIWSTLPTGGGPTYGTKQGTSMAAPHVTGAAALIMAMNGGLIEDHSAKNIIQRMALDVGPAGHDAQYGAGVLRMNQRFLQTLRDASAFVGNVTLDELRGTYDRPWPTIQEALNNIPNGGVLVLNAGDNNRPESRYPPITINKACTLTALPDRRVFIGQ